MEKRNPTCDLCLSTSCVKKGRFICCNPLCARRGKEITLTEFEELRFALVELKNETTSIHTKILIRAVVVVMDEVLDLKREVRR